MTQQRVWSGIAVMLLAGAMPGCVGVVGTSNTPPPTQGGIKQINHIIVMAQENEGLDHYFGAMRQYWKANGIADQSFDG